MNDPAVAGGMRDDGVEARWDRIAAVAGLLFIVLVVASFFTPETPEYGSTADELAAGLTDERAGHQMSLLLGFLADIAFLVFLAGVWSRFRRYEGSGGMMSGLFAIAGAAFVATIVVSEGIYLALVQAAESADPRRCPRSPRSTTGSVSAPSRSRSLWRSAPRGPFSAPTRSRRGWAISPGPTPWCWCSASVGSSRARTRRGWSPSAGSAASCSS
ncbi:hypothetical protein [Blastococcus brunescens]|uniref:DUF4386 family protein n=1 Tax=Blastococcus brunescens TaxID=1564165 RepID=A0ABZ1AZP5_9ACTN|nr:hypothetical protein [Blastococcus sp. BMG 8361]WRL63959.1 hypothetical protein U6N30_30920 [Blastococcus sp. BMG 8361]